MNLDAEQRDCQRLIIETPIIFADRNTDIWYDAKLCNCSKDGMRFSSEIPLQPGSNISIKLFDSLSAENNFPHMSEINNLFDAALR